MALTPEQREEIEKAFIANRLRQEAMEAERRKQAGGVLLCLETAPDDHPQGDPDFQEELRKFSTALAATGLRFSQYAVAFDAIDGGGFPLPQYAVVLQTALTAVAGLCGAWVQARWGRKVRLKIGDIEAEGRTVSEIEALLKQAKEFQEATRQAGDA